ncbi:ABC transporter substrate-binding protein [Marinobacterium rhizophilum]|uniref:ABC transporter substrate-binding protein n=1 Tax=Marinobacterium rhizophilum TaxID=420402 RepID=A0ABY5HMM7_9GAMM|nr:ABC transporter substrate-binding protein [Marinobacterium rhizophilum]UTW12843.1 ABC transporter substrate-binding protein [Marinobacterium rhizophilum]
MFALKPLAMLAALLASPAAQAQAPPAPASAVLNSIGVSVSDLGNPYFVEIARGAERRARELGGDQVRVQVVSSAYDLPRQIRQIDAFISDAVQLILLSAADRDGIAPAVQRARNAGIHVIAVDVEAAGAEATITTDNRVAGTLACDFLARRIGGSGKVVIINGPAVSSVIERVQGCRAALADFTGIELLSDSQNGGGAREGGLEKMTALMTAHPDIQGVFTINDPSALGAEQAAHQAGRSNFVIVSIDGSPAALEQLSNPASLLEATAAQFPGRIAERAIDTGLQLLRGETLDKQRILIRPELLTRDNVQDYRGWNSLGASRVVTP